MSGISESSVSWPSLSRIACLKLGCSGDSALARKRVPSRTPSAPSDSAADKPAPVGDPAGRQHRNRRDRIDHHRHQRHARLPADMPAALGALRDDDVGAASAARTASGTPPAMKVTLLPAAWARAI